jgi:predicted ribosome quality control (RQC) complex YloA/Tae2 family protein
LEQEFRQAEETEAVESARRSLKTHLDRVIGARDRALADVAEGIAMAQRAPELTAQGQLILAYQGQIQPGQDEVEVWNMEGQAVSLRLNPELSAVENAEGLFKKAKKAKAREGDLREQHVRLSEQRDHAAALLDRVLAAKSVAEIEALQQEAQAAKWLTRPGSGTAKAESGFQGHRVGEYLSPGGWRVLVGESATANDFLTGKVAKPNDWWFHVRGGVGSHVVLQSGNQPQRVGFADQMFAARLAKRNSAAKHSSYVAVDMTLKKYVRKPRGSAPGLAVYTHERTLHVEDE